MRYLMFAFTLALFAAAAPAQAQADAISKYFAKYVDDERFTVVYISPKMFQMFDKMDLNLNDKEAEAIKEVVRDMRGLRILVAETDALQFYKEASATLNKKEYEVLMTVRTTDKENVDFLIKDTGDIIDELLLIVGSADNFVLMSFVGQIDINKISKMAKAFEE
jgi:cellulose biosynthesis protein BcsQ